MTCRHLNNSPVISSTAGHAFHDTFQVHPRVILPVNPRDRDVNLRHLPARIIKKSEVMLDRIKPRVVYVSEHTYQFMPSERDAAQQSTAVINTSRNGPERCLQICHPDNRYPAGEA